ncbi:MAG: type II secretion system protein [Candidatus Omnitrophota bacterium]
MRNRRAGVTLIELVIAVMIIAVAAIASFQFLVYCDKFVSRATDRIVAANLARETMEMFYGRDYDSLGTGSGSVSLPAGNILSSRHTNVKREYRINEHTDSGTGNVYKVILVTVSWDK